MLFDSHCHLTDDRFADDVDDVVRRALEAGVRRMVTIASDLDDAARGRALAGRHAGAVWWTAGVHPHSATSAGADLEPRLREACGAGAVALGETGLDYHYDHSPRDVQRSLFDRHLALAADIGLPVVVHCREADEDVAAALRSARGVTGVLHCFAGGRALLDAGLDAGWYVSFAGLVSFRNFEAADLLCTVPDDRLLVETDSPYLAPVPHRGRRNEPAFVAAVADACARLRGIDADQLAAQTYRNASRFYGIE